MLVWPVSVVLPALVQVQQDMLGRPESLAQSCRRVVTAAMAGLVIQTHPEVAAMEVLEELVALLVTVVMAVLVGTLQHLVPLYNQSVVMAVLAVLAA